MKENRTPPSPEKPEQEGYTPASPVKRTLAWIALVYVLIILALTTYYYYNGVMLTNLGPLLAVPGLVGLGILVLVSWRTAGRPGTAVAIAIALVCFLIALATLPIGVAGLLSNFGTCVGITILS